MRIMGEEKRRDNKGRLLLRGECQEKDGSYTYRYTDKFGKRRK
jgi:DNA binding domain of tn916 integrase.